MSDAGLQDTIVAIATPAGQSGIGIVRVSGPLCQRLAELVFRPSRASHPLSSHRFYHGDVLDPSSGRAIDEALVVLMRAPRTYTRQDCLEIQAHGGRLVLEEILRTILRNGARLADPGEFTLRAFLNGRIDLTQAEAVVEVIQARSIASLELAQRQLSGGLSRALRIIREDLLEILSQVEAAIDFPEEGIPEQEGGALLGEISRIEVSVRGLIESYAKGRLCKEGASIILLGQPNAGKSSLLNAMVGFERAIVTDIPGTTRDLVEETMEWRGLPIRAIDTVGLRDPADPIEAEGQRFLRGRVPQADLIVWVMDTSRPLGPLGTGVEELARAAPGIVALNKIDLPPRLSLEDLPRFLRALPSVRISAKEGIGITDLLDAAKEMLMGGAWAGELVLTNVRHREKLEICLDHLVRAKDHLQGGGFLELAATDLRESTVQLGELLGEGVGEEILDRIFSRFCIGK